MRVRISFSDTDVRHIAAYKHLENRPKKLRADYLTDCITKYEEKKSLLDEISNVICEQIRNARLTIGAKPVIEESMTTSQEDLPSEFLDEFANWS